MTDVTNQKLADVVAYIEHGTPLPDVGAVDARFTEQQRREIDAARGVKPQGDSAGHIAPIPSALARQVGGNHYKNLAIQPMEYSLANKLDAAQHTVIKYVTRFRDKGGIADLEKAIHTLELLIEHERGRGTA